MRAIWCGFALGVIALQRQAALPGWGAWVGLVLAIVLATGWAVWGLGAHAQADDPRMFGTFGDQRWRTASGWAAVWLAAGCAGFGYAAWRAELRLAQALPAAWQTRNLDVTGSISSLPSYGENGASFLFRVESWGPHEETHKATSRLPQLIQLSWVAREAPLPPLVPGARWRLAVRLKRPHGNGNFGLRDTEATLLARGVRATGYVSDPARAVRLPVDASGVGVRIERARAALRARIDAVLGDAPHRGIVIALATGAQDAVSDADWRLMRNTGTSHLVAISGLHLAFVAGLAGWVVGAMWRRARWRGVEAPLFVPAQKVAVAGALLAAGIYAALAGFNVPVQRALWMLAVVALALFAGREVARSHVLAWALGLVLLRDPWAVTAAGFWLSFCAVGAILFAASGVPRLYREAPQDLSADEIDPMRDRAEPPAEPPARDRWLRRLAAMAFPRGGWREAMRRIASRVGDSARVQWAVTLALAPLTAYWFAQIPLIGPFANAFAIPWVSMLVTPLVIGSAALPAPIDAFALRVAHSCLDGLAATLGALEGLPWAVLRLPQPGAWPLACAAVGVAWCLAPRGWPLRWLAPFTWLPLLVPAPTGPPPGAFRLTALDIGQGTSVLVETAHHRLLFDAGPGPESTQAGERIVVPYLQAHGIGHLDALMISHDDSDHSGGAQAVLDAVDVGQFVAGILPAHPLWASARAKGAQTVQCAAGQRWRWDGVDFEVLWPDPGPLAGKPNAHCCVLRVTTAASAARETQAGPVSALVAADIEAGVERTLLARDPARLRAQVLVVPHHGSRTSSTEPFLDSVRPLVAIFQVGYLNRFHHPHPGVYARYAARHIVLARSDAHGAVRVEAGPGALAVERYRDTQRRYWMDPPTQD
ncbi:ComEC/Rec2 family competence protein [Paraburkholderia sp. J10-1]|uniref:ComEC/Rec2 family competence protein n=1 Tax=Paraburkholderia sp. J10-1 TaxID=2805430 RepID=UPI002AB6B177|nr:ComEC/Rec2 family competence protein [Paraburkholderia sp. J10-1]